MFWVRGSLLKTRCFTDFAESLSHHWMIQVSFENCSTATQPSPLKFWQWIVLTLPKFIVLFLWQNFILLNLNLIFKVSPYHLMVDDCTWSYKNFIISKYKYLVCDKHKVNWRQVCFTLVGSYCWLPCFLPSRWFSLHHHNTYLFLFHLQVPVHFSAGYRPCSLSPSFNIRISSQFREWNFLGITLETWELNRVPYTASQHHLSHLQLSVVFQIQLCGFFFAKFITPVHQFPLGSCFFHTAPCQVLTRFTSTPVFPSLCTFFAPVPPQYTWFPSTLFPYFLTPSINRVEPGPPWLST